MLFTSGLTTTLVYLELMEMGFSDHFQYEKWIVKNLKPQVSTSFGELMWRL